MKKTKLSAAEIEKAQIKFAKSFFQFQPFATKVYVALKTKLDISFIQKHWTEISGEKPTHAKAKN